MTPPCRSPCMHLMQRTQACEQKRILFIGAPRNADMMHEERRIELPHVRILALLVLSGTCAFGLLRNLFSLLVEVVSPEEEWL
eukprot:5957890-Amphidinium_carterae.1